jgi:hypothetical protein
MTTTNSSTTIAGNAIYLELAKPNITTQMLIMPEGTSSSHKTVPMTVYRRRITAHAPRRTWKAVSAPTTARHLISSALDTEPAVAVNAVLTPLHPLFRSVAANEYVLCRQPIYVEVTPEDLELCITAKTPYKVLGRVMKVRKSLGFPKEIIHELLPPTPAATSTF